MDIFLARQPIFNNKGEVFGYEILYRDGKKNEFHERNAEMASGNVLTSSFIDFGINELTNNKKAFINFTGDLLKNKIATIFPKEYLVVEILENVTIDDEIIESCRYLKQLGYTIALDDFTYQPSYDELIDFIDIIKVDFRATTEIQCREIVSKFQRKGLYFLAEKVESKEEYALALEMGYTFFQGYYFSVPELGHKKKFIPYKTNYIELINILNSQNPEFGDISAIIEKDLAFSYDILRLVNSAYYGRIVEITSIRHALVVIGLNELKKWLYLAFFRKINVDKPNEIINICMLRGKFMENIAMKAGRKEISSELLTLGMFSMIDLLLDKPMDKALVDINFSNEIKNILCGKQKKGYMANCYQTVLCYEEGNWDKAGHLAARLGITQTELNNAYIDSIKWMNHFKM